MTIFYLPDLGEASKANVVAPTAIKSTVPGSRIRQVISTVTRDSSGKNTRYLTSPMTRRAKLHLDRPDNVATVAGSAFELTPISAKKRSIYADIGVKRKPAVVNRYLCARAAVFLQESTKKIEHSHMICVVHLCLVTRVEFFHLKSQFC